MAQVALCTIADRAYLPRLLVLANSLARFHPSMCLRVLCLDQATEDVLKRRRGIVSTTSLTELERADPGLSAARGDRSFREYAWTLKPVICLHALEHDPGARAVMFLDADLMFFGNAASVFADLARSSILLVPERPVPADAWSPAGLRPELGPSRGEWMGHYNSGMVAFARDPPGLAALQWWRQSCLYSCRDASVEGRHGDQWYLNALPERFPGVKVTDQPGVGLAPWNARHVAFQRRGERLLADGEPVVFYHFHSLRLRRATPASRLAAWCRNDLGALPGVQPRVHAVLDRHWRLSYQERQLLWQPCRRELAAAVRELERLNYAWPSLVCADPWTSLVADVASELRWQAYLLLGRVLPSPLRVLASRLRARVIRRSSAIASATVTNGRSTSGQR